MKFPIVHWQKRSVFKLRRTHFLLLRLHTEIKYELIESRENMTTLEKSIVEKFGDLKATEGVPLTKKAN
jgi:hypothetical protein